MGNIFHKVSDVKNEETASGKLRRKFSKNKSKSSKILKIEERKPQIAKNSISPAGPSKFAPSHSNYYFSICYRDENELDATCLIDWIPIEVLVHCFTFLSVDDISACFTVSKTFYKAAIDQILWKNLCYRDLKITQKWASISWLEYYRTVRCITWDPENCCTNEFKFTDQNKTITKTTSYGVATARSKFLFVPSGGKYVLEVKINFRRPNFFYGVGFIDKEVGFNFVKAAYPKVTGESQNIEIQERKYQLQWFYWYLFNIFFNPFIKLNSLTIIGRMEIVGIF